MSEPNDHIVVTTAGSATETSAGSAAETTAGSAPETTAASPPAHDPGNQRPGLNGANGDGERGTTAAQLRRFIKSRPYVPMHELRRRFELNGECDEVVGIETPGGRCYIGLPERESRFMADLVRQGEVGLELGHDPETPIVVGVFPMRPVGR